MAQHFLLSAAARTLSLKSIYAQGEEAAYARFCRLRWPETNGKPVCPQCGYDDAYSIKTRRKSKCKACHHQFSVTSGTMFASHKLAFIDLLGAIALVANAAKGMSPSAINAIVCALRFFFKVTLGRSEIDRWTQFVRAPRKLPVILNQEEVTRLIDCAPGPGLQYKAVLSVAYGAGLRVSEVAALKISDIDSQRMLIRIKQGKGRKDRYVMLSANLLELLRDRWREARPAY